MSNTITRFGPGVLYNPKDYLREVQISRQKRLLVEGRDDKELFRRLFLQLFPEYATAVVIDTAEQLRDFDTPRGNRDKVEEICRQSSLLRNAENLVGFVDREFREFDTDPRLHDRGPEHRTEGRLVWSRGHSVENYLFDFEFFKDKAKEYVSSENLVATVQLFQDVFKDAVRVACAVGLAGFHHSSPRLQVLSAGGMHWRCLRIVEKRLSLDVKQWGQQLASCNQPTDWITEAEAQYAKWWPLVSIADYSVVRWLCHGHIGLSTIWAAFGRCAFELSPVPHQEREANAATNADQRVRFRGVVEQWTQHALKGHLDCPRVIFKMLQLSA